MEPLFLRFLHSHKSYYVLKILHVKALKTIGSNLTRNVVHIQKGDIHKMTSGRNVKATLVIFLDALSTDFIGHGISITLKSKWQRCLSWL